MAARSSGEKYSGSSISRSYNKSINLFSRSAWGPWAMALTFSTKFSRFPGSMSLFLQIGDLALFPGDHLPQQIPGQVRGQAQRLVSQMAISHRRRRRAVCQKTLQNI